MPVSPRPNCSCFKQLLKVLISSLPVIPFKPVRTADASNYVLKLLAFFLSCPLVYNKMAIADGSGSC